MAGLRFCGYRNTTLLHLKIRNKQTRLQLTIPIYTANIWTPQEKLDMSTLINKVFVPLKTKMGEENAFQG